jgi:hypothetical protein
MGFLLLPILFPPTNFLILQSLLTEMLHTHLPSLHPLH